MSHLLANNTPHEMNSISNVHGNQIDSHLHQVGMSPSGLAGQHKHRVGQAIGAYY